jgi:chemotaxis protein methyltransferase CheR
MEERQDIEAEMLTTAIYRQYGFDFRNYAPTSLRRRLVKQVQAEGLSTISGLQERVLYDEACMERLLLTLSISVTSMFRDPEFHLALRTTILPTLRTYPSVRVWVAGCSTGEEVYSVAILLEEEGLYDRVRIYATDMNEVVLDQAKKATYPLERMKEYTENYQKSGARASFSDYYTADSVNAVLDASLRRNIVFTQHNLATDGPFHEFQLILCRNVMIYFDKELQARVVRLFSDSLCTFGVLGLGRQESLRFSDRDRDFEALDAVNKLYRKVAS